jgi:hypothetical protein
MSEGPRPDLDRVRDALRDHDENAEDAAPAPDPDPDPDEQPAPDPPQDDGEE